MPCDAKPRRQCLASPRRLGSVVHRLVAHALILAASSALVLGFCISVEYKRMAVG